MTTTEPDPTLETPDPEDLVEVPGPTRVLGRLPRLPGSPRPPTPPPPEAGTAESRTSLPPPGSPPATGSGRSSTASTEPTPPAEPAERVDPKDFRDAIRAGVDIGFVLAGQAAGTVHARRTGLERDSKRWQPTLAERRRVAEPAHRIAKRHIANSADAMDAIDVALMAAGVGAYVARAAFDLDELEDLDADA